MPPEKQQRRMTFVPTDCGHLMDVIEERRKRMSVTAEDRLLHEYPLKPFRRTPFIVTLYEEKLTHIDIQNFIEMGLAIIRFKITHILRDDKLRMMALIRKAQEFVCDKYEVSTWPIALCIDLPNAAIRSGYISEQVGANSVDLIKGSTVEITSDVKYWNKCDATRVFIDDPYTIQAVQPGQYITFCHGGTKLICFQVKNKETILCKVIRGGRLIANEFIAFCDMKYKRPPLSKYDKELLEFGKEFKLDIIAVYLVRMASTIRKVREFCGEDYQPLILSTICDREGLEDIDDIIKASDGIILARDLFTHQLTNRNMLAAIQMQVCAKCKQAGKPFYISGGVLDGMLTKGALLEGDLNDISNAVYQGAGFMLRHYSHTVNVLEAMKILDSVSKAVESCTSKPDEFWRLTKEFYMPVNAAEACVLAAVLMARKTLSLVIINPTVTGRTSIQLSHLAPSALIIAISRNPATARRLQLYSGIHNIVYDKPSKKDWHDEMEARVEFAVNYAIKKEILSFSNPYVTIRRASAVSPFCDSVAQWYVKSQEIGKYKLVCDYPEFDSASSRSSDISMMHINKGK